MENLIKKSLTPKAILVLSLIFLCLVGISCSKQDTYYHVYEMKDANWVQKDTLRFTIDTTMFKVDSVLFETNIPYTLSIEVTNNVNYPYRNIWFFIQSNIDSDSVYAEQSKEYQLADIEGKWLGSGFGNLFQSSFVVFENISFSEKRNYYIKVEHGMRDELLTGIEKVGIKLSKKEK
ncbi:MAG: gliding motility lipoprotein GldH [Dysgonomonas sp.]